MQIILSEYGETIMYLITSAAVLGFYSLVLSAATIC